MKNAVNFGRKARQAIEMDGIGPEEKRPLQIYPPSLSAGSIQLTVNRDGLRAYLRTKGFTDDEISHCMNRHTGTYFTFEKWYRDSQGRSCYIFAKALVDGERFTIFK